MQGCTDVLPHHIVAWEVTHRQNTSHCSREYLPSQLRCPKCNWHGQKTSPHTDINCVGPHHRHKCWPPQLRLSLINLSRIREFIESNKKKQRAIETYTNTAHETSQHLRCTLPAQQRHACGCYLWSLGEGQCAPPPVRVLFLCATVRVLINVHLFLTSN